MNLPRDKFISHFWPCVHVRVMGSWRKCSKTPPEFIGAWMHKAMTVSNGRIPITSRAFDELIQPVVNELHRTMPKGMRPEASDLLARAYDALSAAGVEVEIGPPLQPHGR